MKDNAVDEIFRDKIKELERVPSQGAWDKINSGIQGRNKKAIGLWLKAAVIALVCLASAYLVFHTLSAKKGTHPPVAEVSPRQTKDKSHTGPSPEAKTPKQSAPVQKQTAPKEPVKIAEKNNVAMAVKEKKEPLNQRTLADNQEKSQSAAQQLIPTPAKISQLATITPSARQKQPAHTNDKKEERPERQKLVITIIYKSGGKNQTALAAETQRKESSTLQKIVVRAKEIKDNDLSLAGLREAKDDLFALDFRSDEK